MYSKYKNGGNIIVKEIDTCSEDQWEDREKYWIKYYKDLGYNLMNIDKGGRGVVTKEKRSSSSIERSIKGHEIPIIALNMDGTFNSEYESIAKASEILGFKSHSSINNVLKGRSKSAGGYMWVYKKDYDPNKNYSYEESKLGISVFEFDLQGNLIKEWYNFSRIDDIEGYSHNGVRAAIKNKKLYHNHYWSISDSIDLSEYEKYFNFEVTNLSTSEKLKFHSQADICRSLNASSTSVCLSIKNNKPLYNKYKIDKI